MRLHVGTHIVKGDTRGPVCGFCGTLFAIPVKRQFSSGTGVNRTDNAFCGCKYFCDFSLKAAESHLKGNPCTNRPVECKACSNGSVFWSYNLMAHYTDSHQFTQCPLVMSQEKKKIMLSNKH